jgi:hypothetical protein
MGGNPNTQIIPSNDVDDEYSGQLLKGARAKWVAGTWTMDGVALVEEHRFLVVGTGFALQRWTDGLPQVIVAEPGKSLPDPAEINKSVPPDQWPIGKFSGQPEGPWKKVAYVYLLRVHDAARFTCINSTWGQIKCVRSIRDRVKDMTMLRGASVYPVVRLTSAPNPTKKYPLQFRPELEVTEWRQIGVEQKVIESQPVAQIGTLVEPPTIREELDDDLPDHLKGAA